MEHDIKCLPEYFGAVKRGVKTFELQKVAGTWIRGDGCTADRQEFDHAT